MAGHLHTTISETKLIDSYVRPSVASDVAFIAANMREGDVEEVRACGHEPLTSLYLGYHLSTVCYTLTDFDGTPFAMLGVNMDAASQTGSIWMLGTKGIEDVKVTFLRRCRKALSRIYEETGAELLFNYTYAENTVHHKWLKWLGFSFIRQVALQPHDKLFIEFARLRGQDNV